MSQYTWEFKKDEEIWRYEVHETIEKCIEDAKEENKFREVPSDFVFVGECNEFTPCIDAEYILDSLQEQAYDICGEIGEDWQAYDIKEPKQLSELSDSLTDTVNKWLEKYGYKPTFYSIENIKEYPLN